MAKKGTTGSGFNTPFDGLKRIASKATEDKATEDKATKDKARPAPVKAAPSQPAKPVEEGKRATPATTANPNSEDDQFFERAMRGVKPLGAAERGRRAAPLGSQPAPAAPRPRTPARNEDADAEAELADMVTGGGGGGSRPVVDVDTDGHAGRAAGIDRRLLRRLRDGEYPIEARLDLHGRAREEAEEILERFIAQSVSQGRRCVLVIHGRGLNSGDAGPVLRDATQRILAGSRVGRAVLAFTLAAPAQGGDGATLVLLRKKKG
jgi:DNA-nicking Smr family endonuclease